MTSTDHPYSQLLRRVRTLGLVVGGVGVAAVVVGALLAGDEFFYGYLVGFVFWIGMTLGSLALLALHQITGGNWSLMAQRPLESAALNVPLMALAFVPLLFGLHALYEWSHAEAAMEHVKLAHKKPYLNVPFWVVRQVIYFAVYTAIAYGLARWSRRLEETRDDRYAVRLRRLAAGGLIVHVLLLTFTSTDWTMSLDPEWFSTIYPWLYLVSQALTAACFVILVLRGLVGHAPHARVMRTKHFHDFGNLLLALVVLWTYMMFFQYLIVWSGNVPEDIIWYVQRASPAWQAGITVLVLLHFVVPFAVLLSRRAKRSRRMLPALAGLLLACQLYYVVFLILPSLSDVTWVSYVVALAAFVGIGGLWLAAWAWHMARRPPLPRYDPRFESVIRKLKAPAS